MNAYLKKVVLKNLMIAALFTWILTASFFWLWFTYKSILFIGLLAYGVCIAIKATIKYVRLLLALSNRKNNPSPISPKTITLEFGLNEFTYVNDASSTPIAFLEIKNIKKFQQSLIIHLKKNPKHKIGSIVIPSNAFREITREQLVDFLKDHTNTKK
jgi:hypothetical protein